jgi:hypothetical protein
VRHLRSSNAKPLVFLGLIAAVKALVTFVVFGVSRTGGATEAFLGLSICAYFGVLGWMGLTAQMISIRNGDLFVRGKKELERFPIESVVSVRAMPVFRHLTLR